MTLLVNEALSCAPVQSSTACGKRTKRETTAVRHWIRYTRFRR